MHGTLPPLPKKREKIRKNEEKNQGESLMARIMNSVTSLLPWSHGELLAPPLTVIYLFLRGKTSSSQIASEQLEMGLATQVGSQGADFPF